jgi:hypothetical protein
MRTYFEFNLEIPYLYTNKSIDVVKTHQTSKSSSTTTTVTATPTPTLTATPTPTQKHIIEESPQPPFEVIENVHPQFDQALESKIMFIENPNLDQKVGTTAVGDIYAGSGAVIQENFW